MVLVADVYAAGEAPIEGVDRDALVAGLDRARPSQRRGRSPSPAELAPMVRELARPGDIVVCLGAGSITNWANALPADLARAATSREPGRMTAACAQLADRRLPPVRGRLTAERADRPA